MITSVHAMREGKSGTFQVRTWRLWYGILGALDASKPPLVCVPGGPGIPHDALETLVPLAPTDRALVMYDPSGSGRSDRPTGVAWDLEVFVEELIELRRALGLDRVYLFGASFGGLVSLVY